MLKDTLRELRVNAGFTLEEMGKKIGVSAATVQRYESQNGIQTVPYKSIIKYAEVFGVSPGSLFGETETATPDFEVTTPDGDTMEVSVLQKKPRLKLTHTKPMTPKANQYLISERSLRVADKYELADEITKQMVDRILGVRWEK
jgi:transcriptional regulator with XRE-family HTH domain